MAEKIKTLVLEANGYGWGAVAVDTLLWGILKMRDGFEPPFPFNKSWWVRIVFSKSRYSLLSYAIDWRDALCAAPELEVELCNINNLVDYRQRRKAIENYPLIIILHSAAGDMMSLLLKTAHWFQQRRGQLVVFIGNEYDLMAEKFAFLRTTGADYVCSQMPIEAARWLYAKCQPTQVLPMPHALNPQIYYPDSQSQQRILDLGFIGAIYPYFIGDTERNSIIHFFQKHGSEFGLNCDIRGGHIDRVEWARFLNTCKGIIGGEAGSYYLDRHGQIIAQAKRYLKKHPKASFEEIFARFFQAPEIEYVSGKAISSRHFEPIGTQTCQMLLEGDYNGILKPDEHYISVKKDFSNIEEAIRQFKDDAHRMAIAKRAYEYVMSEHTYQHRVKSLIKTVMENADS